MRSVIILLPFRVLPGSQLTVDTPSAIAKSIAASDGSNVTVASGNVLNLTDYVINESAAGDFVVEHGAELIQSNDFAVNSGAITVEKDFDLSEDRDQFNFTISPVTGQKMQNIYAGMPLVYEYDETQSDFVDAGEGDYVAGKGFAVEEPSEAAVSDGVVTAVMQGVPYNGILGYPLSYTSSTALPGLNLVGNPYPSKLDIAQLYAENETKITPSFLFWNGSSDDYSIYNVYTGTGNAAPASFGSSVIPTSDVNSGDAFMVRAQATADGSNLNFFNSYRNVGEASSDTKDRYWLTMRTPDNTAIMSSVVYFEGGNDEFWIDDSETTGNAVDFYSLAEGEQLAIQGRAPFVSKDRVPFGVRLDVAGVYIISIHDMEGVFEEGQTLFIRDKYLKLIYDLSSGPYKFVGRPGEVNDRFEIIYRKPVLNPDDAIAIFAGVSINKINHHIVASSIGAQIEKVEVFNLMGTDVYTQKNVRSLTHKFPTSMFSNQIIVVRVTTVDGEVVTKKFVNLK